jgi:predicted LPLAT superfamily acyltransferase
VESVVDAITPGDLPCLIVDDGSGPGTRQVLERLAARRENVEVLRIERNAGKGAALKTGFREARARGFTHVVQLDADGQHRAEDVAGFVDAMKEHPDALVLGVPVFDETAPLARLLARQLSRVMVWIACLSREVPDPLCGFRGVPLEPALAAVGSAQTGDRMEFEPELAVRMVWQGTPVVPLPTKVRYVPGGLSHFSFRRDYPLLAGVYTRLVFGMSGRLPALLGARLRARRIQQAKDWSRFGERGTMGALRFGAAAYRLMGRRLSMLLLYPAVAWFYLRDREGRGASRRYLDSVWARPEGRASLGARPGAFSTCRHLYEFAVQTFDRMVLWGGGLDHFQMDHHGSKHLFDLKRDGRGALLLGAHLGSFDMARTLARDSGIAVNIVMFTANAERINRLFEELDPESQVRVVSLDPTSVRTAFEIKACLDRGELVAILADRVPAGARERPIEVEFLGRRRPFPRSPFLLATLLGCPVLVSLCVRTGSLRYHTWVEPISPGLRLPRAEREKGAEELVRAYVAELERACLNHPYQWFNFYDAQGTPQ